MGSAAFLFAITVADLYIAVSTCVFAEIQIHLLAAIFTVHHIVQQVFLSGLNHTSSGFAAFFCLFIFFTGNDSFLCIRNNSKAFFITITYLFIFKTCMIRFEIHCITNVFLAFQNSRYTAACPVIGILFCSVILAYLHYSI